MSKRRITENTTLEEILRDPEAGRILVKHGIYCPVCPFARLELGRLRIGDVARTYNADLDELLRELNENLKAKE